MNKAKTKISNKAFTNIVAVITALSLVFLQVPVTGWSSRAMADSTDAAQEQLAANMAVDVPLVFENAYITYQGQIIAPPASYVTIPGGAAMEFTAAADSGYQVESVKATINGQEVELSPDANGVYKLSASDVVTTSNITVHGITAPTVEDVVVEEVVEPEPEAIEGEQAEGEAGTTEGEAANSEAAAPAEQAVNTKTEFVYEDASMKVTATLADPSVLPANVQFKVTPITAQSKDYNYDAYMEALNKDVAVEDQYTEENTALYDIAFLATDASGKTVEVQPAEGTVAIEFQFKQDQLADEASGEQADVEIVHLAIAPEAKEAAGTTAKATDITANDITVEVLPEADVAVNGDELSFKATSFSPYGVKTSLRAANVPTSTSYTVNVDFYDYNGTTAWQYSGNDDSLYIYVEITDKATGQLAGWDCREIKPQGKSHLSETFTQFRDTSQKGYHDANYSINYNSDQYEVSYARLYTRDAWNNPPSYHQIREQLNDWEPIANDVLDGCTFLAGSADAASQTIKLKRWNGAKLLLHLTLDPAVATEITESDGYYLHVTLYHSTTNKTYFVKQLKTSDFSQSGELVIEANQWYDTNGSYKQNEKFTAGEQGIEVRFVHARPGQEPGFSDIAKANPDNVEKVISGGVLKGAFSVDYVDDGKAIKDISTDIESQHITETHYNVRLAKLNIENYALTPEDILGGAVEFGIVADRYEQTVHTETNFAVNSFRDVKDQSIEVDGSGTAAIPFYVGYIDNSLDSEIKLWLAGGMKVPADVFVSPESYEQVKVSSPWPVNIIQKPQSEINSFVNGLIAAGRAMSDELASHTTMALYTERNNYVVDTTAFPDGATIYVNADGIANSINSNGWIINKLSNQSIVFNFSSSDHVEIGKFTVNATDVATGTTQSVDSTTQALDGDKVHNQLVDDLIFEHITFNMPNASSVHTNDASGLFLAPRAQTFTQSNGAGWILTGGTVHSDTEWHFYRHNRHYTAKGDFTFNVQKKLVDTSGNDVPFVNKNYRFALYQRGNDGNPAGDRIELAYADVTSGLVSFQSIKYTQSDVPQGQTKTFKYVIVELVPDNAVNAAGVRYADASAAEKASGTFTLGGVTYTAEPIAIDVIATDNGSGAIECTVKVGDTTISDTDGNKTYFVGDMVNTVQESDSASVSAEKVWTDGNDRHASDNVTVKLQQKIGNGAWSDTIREKVTNNGVPTWQDTESKTATINAESNWKASFGSLPKVVPTSLTDVDEPDAQADYRVVEIEVNGEAFNPVIEGERSGSTYMFTITNEVEETTGSLVISKSLTDNGSTTLSDAAKAAMADRTYTFGIFTDEACTTPYTVDGTAKTVTITIGADGAAATSEEVTDLPEGDYWIKEVNAENGSVPVVNPVKVTVEAGKTGAAAPIASFVNNYVSTSITFAGTKSIDKRALKEGDTFSFTMTGDKGESWDFSNDATGKINYPTINYTLADVGKHVYTVVENATNINGVTKATTTHEVTVNVALENGALVARSNDAYTTLDFVNKYTASGEITLEGAKTLTGRNMIENEFDFEIVEGTGENARIVATGKNAAADNGESGKITFSKIEYGIDDLGTHTYTVRETTQNGNGIIVGGQAYTITVLVTDKGDGELEAVRTDNAGNLSFTNTYYAEESIKFTGTKSISVTAGKKPALKDRQFSFTVTEVDKDGNAIEGKSTTVYNKADGTIEYPVITYTQADAGDHYYVITETTLEEGTGFAIATAPYELTVHVADDGKGTLTVTSEGDDRTALDFVNTYEATGSVIFEGTKTIAVPEGQVAPTPADGKFIFTVTEVDENDQPVPGKSWTATNTGKTINYPTIGYTLGDVGVHHYVVAEEAMADPSPYTADTTTYKVDVTVSDNGTGTLTVAKGDGCDVLNFENGYEATGSIELKGEKTLEGKALEDNMFRFTVTEVDENGQPVPGKSWTATNTGKTINYPTIGYTLEDVGTHIYKVSEVSLDAAVMKYDERVYTISVTVADSDDHDGNLAITMSGDDPEKLDFTNTYTSSDKVVLEAWKTLNNEAPAPGAFSFTLTGGKLPEGSAITVSNDEFGHVVFGEFEFDQNDVGESFTYTIVENAGDDPLVTYDRTPRHATVTVGYNNEGSVEATVKYEGNEAAPTFTNASTTTYTLEGTKTIENRAFKQGDSITFSVAGSTESELPEGKTVPMPASDSVTISPTVGKTSEPFAFGAITYDASDVGKTYRYTITEQANMAGVNNDTTVSRWVEVTVGIQQGNIIATATRYSDDEAKLAFTNTYTATGSITFEGEKTLEGRDLTATDTYAFLVTEDDTTKFWPATSDSDGTINYPTITYTLDNEGTHTYTVTEVSKSGAGVTVDNKAYHVSVTVADKGDGNLAVTPSGDDPEKLDFVNTYEAKTTYTLEGTKSIDTRDLTGSDVFEFTVQEVDEDGIAIEGKSWTVNNTADGVIAYPTIQFTQDDKGTHHYAVSEVVKDDKGITTNRHVYQATIEVTDDGKGTLTATGTDNAKALDFVNQYRATGDVTFEGTKKMTGRALTESDVFQFNVVEDDWVNAAGETIAGKAWTVTNAGATIDYPTIYYTLDDVGTHTYTVTEVVKNDKGVTSSNDSYRVQVTVADSDAHDGSLKITASENAKKLDFENTYTADGSIEFEGAKSLEGRDLTDKDTYSFTIQEVDKDGNAIEGKSWTGSNEGANINYQPITYTLDDVGEHTYLVSEDYFNSNNVTSDSTVHEVKVKVSDNGEGGLNVDVLKGMPKALNFKNTYTASGSLELTGTKTLTGRTMKANEFHFVVLEGSNVVSTGANNASGEIEFSPITYSLGTEPTHHYVVKEVQGEAAGVTYDDAEYELTVNVGDNGTGKLVATIEGEAPQLAFVNTYESDDYVVFEAWKTLNEKPAAADSFSFTLQQLDASGEPIANKVWTAQNDATGKVSFAPISFDQEDVGKTFFYAITENVPANPDPNMTYDSSVKKATVTVGYDGDGNVEATLEYEGTDVPTFENTSKTSVEFSGTKSLTGRELAQGDEYAFVVKDAAGEVVSTGTSARVEGGQTSAIMFTPIWYTVDDVETSPHVYTVSEEATGDNNVAKDNDTYTVEVDVSVSEAGVLQANVTSNNMNALDFTNTYSATGSVTFEGVKAIDTRALTEDDIFSFEVQELDAAGEPIANKVWSAQNDATGKINYPAINYTLGDLGTHTYRVKETSKDGNGVTVDANAHEVTVTVADDVRDGQLEITKSDNWNELDFENTYAATGSVKFEGKKTLDGRTLTVDDVFTFTIQELDVDGEPIAGKVLTAQNDATGKIAYPTITYTLDDVGNHAYRVTETTASGNGITVSKQAYTVNVNVADVDHNGKLTITKSDNWNALDFVNTYAATGSITFEGTKTMANRQLDVGETYTFQVLEGETVVANVTSDSTGKIAYPAINYTLGDLGTHTYTVQETSKDGNGVTVDANAHEVTVTVADDVRDGQLEITKGDNWNELDFENTYAATGSVKFEGTKTISGRDLVAGEFSFRVQEVDENDQPISGKEWVVKNGADGKIAYPTIGYALGDVGDHFYIVTETSSNGNGVSVDSATSHKVSVNVADVDHNGKLTITKSDNWNALDFANTYAATGSVKFEGTKTLTGRSLTAGEFTFVVKENGEPVAYGSNRGAAAGQPAAITFDAIDYTLDDIGTHTYTVTEVKGSDSSLTYDDASYTVTVTVADVVRDGQLEITKSDNWNALAFTNAYTTNGKLWLNAKKTINRSVPADGEFSFTLTGDKLPAEGITASNDENGLVTFGPIEFDSSDIGQDFSFAITENAGSVDGMTYSTATENVTVHVKANEAGELSFDTTYESGEVPTFTNDYVAIGSIEFEGTKSIDTRKLIATDNYTYTIQELGEGGQPIEGKTWTGASDVTGVIDYQPISYTLADLGTHTYRVTEDMVNANGVVSSTQSYIVTVKVADDVRDGALEITASDNADELDFVNTYTANGSIKFEGAKSIDTRELKTDDMFEFSVEKDDGTVVTALSDSSGVIDYPTIYYTIADAGKSYTYTISESAVDSKGVKSATNTYEVTVDIVDNGDGTLGVTARGADETALDFVNAYTATGEMTFKGTKTLEGRALTDDDEFEFEVRETNRVDAEGNALADVVKTGMLGENGAIIYPTIEYTLADVGTHTYVVTEKVGEIGGISYDDKSYEVVVTVADKEDGTLEVTSSGDDPEKLDFTNTYAATGGLSFAGTKTLEGRTLKATDVFSFQVAETGLVDAEGNALPDAVRAVATNDATGKINYPSISYTLADVGTHTYTITETTVDGHGITTSAESYEVVVTVADKGDGTLEVTPSGDDPEKLDFTNTYAATDSVTFAGTKTIDKRELTDDDVFTFTIQELDVDGQPIADKVLTAQNDATGKISYPTITYTQNDAGTHTYRVSEDAYEADGVKSSTQTYDVVVTVADNEDGTLTVTASDNADELDFVNTYTASGEVNFFAIKNIKVEEGIQGSTRTIGAGDFEFQLSQGDTVIQTKANDADARAEFDTLEFDQEDIGKTYTYTIREVLPEAANPDTRMLNGIKYDSTAHVIKVTVEDNGDGTLRCELDGYNPNEGAKFENEYFMEGSVPLHAKKSLVGGNLEAGKYTFQVVQGDGDARKVVTSQTNEADGSVNFPALSFKSAGEYSYKIVEVVPATAQPLGQQMVLDGVAYDEREVAVTIVARDNGKGGLNFEVKYDGVLEEEGGIATFTNRTIPDATYKLDATKMIEGRNFQPGDSFTFTVTGEALSEGDDVAPMPAATEVTITPTSGDEAVVDFGNIVFTTENYGKSYRYTIQEVGSGTEPVNGLTNDPFTHSIKVTVNDAGDGTMRVDETPDKQDDDLVFTNTYAASGEAVLTATKVLDGRDLADDEFYFELTGDKLPGDVQALRTAAKADGTISFDPITFTQDDAGKDFHYTISEVEGTLGGVTYDKSSHDVTVHVADNGNGTLAISYDYGKDAEGNALGAPEFRNEYRADATSATLEAQKMLVGGTLEGGEFSFTLTGTSDNAAGTSQTVKNDENGKVSFEAIDYDAAGTYEYAISEVVPADATDNGDGTFTGADGIVYDGTPHAATVTVTDNNRGKLEAKVAYDDGATGVSFGNTALVRTGFEFDKYFFGGVGTFDFTMTAVDAQGVARTGTPVDYSDAKTIVDDGTTAFTATVQNGAYGEGGVAKVVFPEIGYAADGDYYYLIEEAESSTPSMIADEAQYLAHVVVANGDVASTTFDLIYDGENYGPTDDLSFYNNSAVMLGFNSLSAQSYTSQAQRTSVYPKAKKYLNDSTDQLVGGEFTFELIDGMTGETIALATNDEAGNIAFYDENTDPGLVYDEPGTYQYVIREVAGDEVGMIYDDSVVVLTVDVVQTEDGLEATTTYNGPGGGEPAFYNVKEGTDVVVQKVSRYGGEGLVDCTYALWMVGPNGDVMIKEATSDETGFIVFKDVTLMAGQKYFFKEVEAPIGHTVDPYRTAYFSLNETGDALVLVEETAADGWHSAVENIELDRAKGLVE